MHHSAQDAERRQKEQKIQNTKAMSTTDPTKYC